MERHRFVKTIVGLGLATSIGIAGLRPDQHVMSADDWLFREQVLSSYPFTPQAVSYLKTIPFFDRHTTTNGGGYEHNDQFGRWIEVFSNQPEAALHEMSHAWFDHETDKDPTFPEQVLEAGNQAADQDVPYGYYWTLKHGHPGTAFKGLGNNATEWYASMASDNMGDIYTMPQPIKHLYTDEFIWSVQLDPNK